MYEKISAGQIISLKRDGKKLSEEQIDWFVKGMLNGSIENFQTSALLMAIYLNGCDKNETAALTHAMLKSGKVLSFNDIKVVDKHSTGGVGDKTSLILGPIAAAAGVKIPMISGRGLGHTGGTLDKIESISGFKTSLPMEKFISIIQKTGLAIIGQSSELAPADKMIYSLRDLTGTVESIPLITSSIMSKKLAEGTSGLVMDIKVGPGAFMKNMKDAKILAKSLRETALSFDKNIITMITDMSQPLGRAIGNSNEVIESIETLKGRGPKDVTNLSVELAAAMILLAEICDTMESARELAKKQISSGKALQKFREMIELQGGNVKVVNDYTLFPIARMETVVRATQSGYVYSIDVAQLGLNVCELGGGRKKSRDKIDHSVGIMNHVKIGQKVRENDIIAVLQHHSHQDKIVSQMVQEMSVNTYRIKPSKSKRLPDLIWKVHCDWSCC